MYDLHGKAPNFFPNEDQASLSEMLKYIHCIEALPQPVKSSIEALQNHLYISTSDVEIAEENEFNNFPYLARQKICANHKLLNSNAEKFYRMFLPILPIFVNNLMKLLLKTTQRVTVGNLINSFCPFNLSLPDENSNNNNLDENKNPPRIKQIQLNEIYNRLDHMRAKELLQYNISYIFIFLIKKFNLSHHLKSEWLKQEIINCNGEKLILQIINCPMTEFISDKSELKSLIQPIISRIDLDDEDTQDLISDLSRLIDDPGQTNENAENGNNPNGVGNKNENLGGGGNSNNGSSNNLNGMNEGSTRVNNSNSGNSSTNKNLGPTSSLALFLKLVKNGKIYKIRTFPRRPEENQENESNNNNQNHIWGTDFLSDRADSNSPEGVDPEIGDGENDRFAPRPAIVTKNEEPKSNNTDADHHSATTIKKIANTISHNNLSSAINLIRTLVKIITPHQHRIIHLENCCKQVNSVSTYIFKQVLVIKQSILQYYILKLIKCQVKYLGKQWKKNNMKLYYAIYRMLRHRLMDDWAYGTGDSFNNRRDYFNEEKMIRAKIVSFHQKRYTNPMIDNTWLSSNSCNRTNNPKPVSIINFANDTRILSATTNHNNFDKNLSITFRNFDELVEKDFDEGELPKAFKEHWEEWVKSEVLENKVNWDEMLRT